MTATLRREPSSLFHADSGESVRRDILVVIASESISFDSEEVFLPKNGDHQLLLERTSGSQEPFKYRIGGLFSRNKSPPTSDEEDEELEEPVQDQTDNRALNEVSAEPASGNICVPRRRKNWDIQALRQRERRSRVGIYINRLKELIPGIEPKASQSKVLHYVAELLEYMQKSIVPEDFDKFRESFYEELNAGKIDINWLKDEQESETSSQEGDDNDDHEGDGECFVGKLAQSGDDGSGNDDTESESPSRDATPGTSSELSARRAAAENVLNIISRLPSLQKRSRSRSTERVIS